MNTKAAIFILFILNICKIALAQNEKSIHQQQSEEYAKIGYHYTDAQWDKFNGYIVKSYPITKEMKSGTMKKIVFGWQPYWNGTNYSDYDFSLLTDLAYFSYELDASSGNYTTIHSWTTSPVVDAAIAAGVRVSLTVTLFANHSTFLSSLSSQTQLVDNLVSLLKARNANGVNIDFEAVPSSMKASLTSFMIYLCTRMHSEIPGSTVSVALPAVEWSDVWDENALSQYVDIFLIMGYDYHYKGDTKAGPVAPKNTGKAWTSFNYNVTKSVRSYLSKGIPKSKLCLAVPYYGYDWQTADSTVNSSVVSGSKGIARLYNELAGLSSGKEKQWNRDASVPYLIYKSSNWQQCWFDDSTSLSYKYDLVNSYDIAGIGIWALGYDQGKKELWNLIKEKFSNNGNNTCSGFFADMGGPLGTYYANDNYTFTISSKGASAISVAFTEFDLNNEDVLSAYEGTSTSGNLIGNYSGSANPGVITSKNGAITFKFTSSSNVPKNGFQAYWNCGYSLPSSYLTLSSSTVIENSTKKTFIGKFSILNTNWKKFELFGNENFDHKYFTISNDTLYSILPLDYEKRSELKILVLGEDITGVKVINNFLITVNDLNETTSIFAHKMNINVKILPNPGSGIFKLNFSENTTLNSGNHAEIYNLKGEKIAEVSLTIVSKNQSMIDLSSFPEGMYFLVLKIDNEMTSVKFAIIR